MSVLSEIGRIKNNIAAGYAELKELGAGISVTENSTNLATAIRSLLVPSDIGAKLYSFGALSDPHLGKVTGVDDFNRAISYLFNEAGAAFICVCGDATQSGTSEHFTLYNTAIQSYKPNITAAGGSLALTGSSSKHVFGITGNHDVYQQKAGANAFQSYMGVPTYYSFTKGDDVFIMAGMTSGTEGVFSQSELQWLYDTLEANKNKRCFVFQHVFPGIGKTPTCGNALGVYDSDCWGTGNYYKVFENLMSHYKNVTFFHGHSHLMFDMQKKAGYANFDDSLGYRSVHIPSVTAPRDETGTEHTEGSEGYLVDVYENGIILRGRNFITGQFNPLARYVLYNNSVATAQYFTGDLGEIEVIKAPVAVTGITISPTSGTLTEGKSVTLTANVLPSNATNKTVNWTSSAPTVASVAAGVVTALKAGTATITATTADGGFTATYTLTVEAGYNNLFKLAEAEANKQLSSTGVSDKTGSFVTGYIPCVGIKKDDRIYVKGATFNTNGVRVINFYDSSPATISGTSQYGSTTNILTENGVQYHLVGYKSNGQDYGAYLSGAKSFRLALQMVNGAIPDDVIITINEPIS